MHQSMKKAHHEKARGDCEMDVFYGRHVHFSPHGSKLIQYCKRAYNKRVRRLLKGTDDC